MYLIHPQKLLVLLIIVLLGTATMAYADSGSVETLGLFEASSLPIVTTSRTPRPTSRIAENVTVITSADIERLNAHTVAEVLQTVPSIQLDTLRPPTVNTGFFNIQGALNTTILVLIDGIRLNDFDQNQAQVSFIPVQQIDRIEIIKGAASAMWGPALGGVINIITKSPNPEEKLSGMVSSSIGSQFTADSRAELSGTVDRLGYYLTAGNIHSDGLTPNTGTNLHNLYGKFSYLLPSKGTATFSLSHLTTQPGMDEGETAKYGFVHDSNEYRRTNGLLKFSQPFAANLTLDLDGYFTNHDFHTKYGGLDQGALVFFNDYQVKDATRGVNARVTWGDSRQNLVTGVEYGHVNARGRWYTLMPPPVVYDTAYDRNWDQWSIYANGTWSIGNLTILPGIRHDLTGIYGDNTSYTLGATYQLTDNTTLRTYAAQGYSLPMLAWSDDKLQKIKTVQAGIETGAVPYLWLKGTYFFNSLRNSLSGGKTPTLTDQDRQGFELEALTVPLYGLSLSSGYTYMYAKDTGSDQQLHTNSNQTVPPHTVKLALKYDNTDLGLRGTLTGTYVFWKADPFPPASDQGMIWDLHLGWKLFPKKELLFSPELFFSGHNLFNGNQTIDTSLYNSAPRWFEGGVRVSF